ncbi:MAG: hypothetical protein C4576_13770 [Desulfobacteraceae bacterium]|nr:MAG: hypothetical protein C4576_13770 [Desulfobacteraceae bacterium]
MSRVIYTGDSAKISFEYGEAMSKISPPDSPLLEWIRETSEDGKKDILLNGEEALDNGVPYLIKDLLLSGKGEVFCISCGQIIPAAELIIGRTSPFTAFQGIDSKIVKDRLSGSGGTVFSCGNGHELFGTRDWVI